MKSTCLSKCKSWLFIFMMLLIFKVGCIQGICIEDERRALLEIKASLQEFANYYGVDNLLSTWVDNGSQECCAWERIKCETTTEYVTHLSLSNMLGDHDSHYDYYLRPKWRLNFSPFLRFKELRSLDLSYNDLDDMIATTGLERLSSLKKLEKLNLSTNYIQTDIFRSFGSIISLKVLDLSYLYGDNQYPLPHDISELSALKNLEVLDVTGCSYYGTIQMQGSDTITPLRKLKILNLGWNDFNESLIPFLSSLRSLRILDLSFNRIFESFPCQALSHLPNLEKLDLSSSSFINGTASNEGCKSLMRLKNLESISMQYSDLNKSMISCLSFLPSLKILNLRYSRILGSSFPMQEFSLLRKLKTLDLSFCDLHSLTLNELHNLRDLEVLLLNDNQFNGTLPVEDFLHVQILKARRTWSMTSFGMKTRREGT
ncbi:putative non-specific serine/threonine protein kinase [Helianthus annuus]|nr:putative non-specific serine/threonine protein kinase [Helianthus annuus]